MSNDTIKNNVAYDKQPPTCMTKIKESQIVDPEKFITTEEIEKDIQSFFSKMYCFLADIQQRIGDIGASDLPTSFKALFKFIDEYYYKEDEKSEKNLLTKFFDETGKAEEYILGNLVMEIGQTRRAGAGISLSIRDALFHLSEAWGLLEDLKRKGFFQDMKREFGKYSQFGHADSAQSFIEYCHQFGRCFLGDYKDAQGIANDADEIIKIMKKVQEASISEPTLIFERRIAIMIIQKVVPSIESLGNMYHLTDEFLSAIKKKEEENK